MSGTCEFDRQAQDAVERNARDRKALEALKRDEQNPYYVGRYAEVRAEVKTLTSGSAMIDLYEKIKRREQ